MKKREKYTKRFADRTKVIIFAKILSVLVFGWLVTKKPPSFRIEASTIMYVWKESA